MASEQRPAETSHLIPSPAQSTDDTMVNVENPRILLPLHPKGLRAFPPEIREYIFKYYFGNSELSSGTPRSTFALLETFYVHDYWLYEEVLAICYRDVTAVAYGHWRHGNHDYDGERDRYDWLHRYCSDLDILPDDAHLVQNLQINYTFPDADGESLSGPPLMSSALFFRFAGYRNITSLTLDFKAFSAWIHGWPKSFMWDFFLNVLFKNFEKLEKLSIVFCGGSVGSSRGAGTGHWGFRYKLPTAGTDFEAATGWHKEVPEVDLVHFEGYAIELLQEGLGVHAKLANIRTSSAEELYTPGRISFCPHAFGEVQDHDVTWFWQAEKGETLTWSSENFLHAYETFDLSGF